ncbi:MAG: Gfo/Idh/MocA family oxidoreductase [Opitutus sp.]|nr:Gfo/Idh/MocA family oxidoreductase [Opitutus sp.]MCS6248617.1 Gfo/Idh/MocA family oxidoreductase [Opitutus sp.]MCS6275382.1 Gfo/Idh/MocA family oxidoreductase [Opitutus sp.]MCS6276107.1 Gfo/Idh/MocA family oxidoreductase [Opitutus sp.]MCS6301201.1 Gfo/Idh/MocA family oxidoreductase [Opitutus sp.]
MTSKNDNSTPPRHVLGVLGLGEGRSIISAALSSQHWKIGNVCDMNEELCRERQNEFALPRYTTRYEELLADPDIDTIAIYTPDQFHARHCIEAFRSGKHVICTKPLFDTLSEAAAVRQAASKAHRRLFVGQSSRFFGPMLRQRADFEARKMGDVYSVEAHYHANHDYYFAKHKNLAAYKPLYGGLSHPVDLVRWYLGPIEEVFGYAILSPRGASLGLQHPDAMHFVLKSKDGRIGRASGCYSTPTPAGLRDSHVTCVLRGVQGGSQADYPELRYSTNFPGEGGIIHRLDHEASFYFRFPNRSHHAGEFQNYIDYFARCLDTGVSAEPDLEEGIETIAIMQAMELSVERGLPVKISDVLASYGLAPAVPTSS